MQNHKIFRIHTIVWGVLAALGGGQAMAGDLVLTNSTVPVTVTVGGTGGSGSGSALSATGPDANSSINQPTTSGTLSIGNSNTSGGKVSIGSASAGTAVDLLGGTNTITVDATTGTSVVGTTTINTTGSASTSIGSSAAASSFTASGGNSSLLVNNGAAHLLSGGNGFSAASAPSTVVGSSLSNGNAASRALVNGASVVNTIQGNTLVDGDMYINGTLAYSSSTAANTTVTGNSTVGSMNVVNAGQNGAVVDANGKITTGATATQATAALTVTNTLGNTHGIVVQEDKTTVSGGSHSTSMTLTDGGAHFSDASTGAPVTVNGVADGKGDFDAVNVRQFGGAIAAVTAMANIPLVDQDKTVAIGVGVGDYMGRQAVAFGGSYRVNRQLVIKGSLAASTGSGGSTATGIGAGWSF